MQFIFTDLLVLVHLVQDVITRKLVLINNPCVNDLIHRFGWEVLQLLPVTDFVVVLVLNRARGVLLRTAPPGLQHQLVHELGIGVF